MDNIRNFAIIAHVDHGKSTLADRFLELTGVVKPGHHQDQLLDKNPISRERGITIKLAPVRMEYQIPMINYQLSNNDQIKNNLNNLKIENLKLKISDSKYILNLVDTPGHVDFSYEVERTLACVEGVILLVDATQGIQAQTIAHTLKAIEQNLTIIPAVNKIDVAHANTQQVKKDIAELLGIEESQIYEISAKTGEGVEKLLKAVIEKIEGPKNVVNENVSSSELASTSSAQTSTLDRNFVDSYRGVIAFVRIFSGEFKKGQKLKLIVTNTEFETEEVGVFTPGLSKTESLKDGEIGYIVTKLKDIHLVRIGDTITQKDLNLTALPGYRPSKSMVFASIFPTDADDFIKLKESLEKLALNDAALSVNGLYSKALGSGFRVGFLGLLHADVVRERLEREYDLSVILTPPTVDYHQINNHFEEPIADVTIVTPQTYLGAVMRLCEQSRGVFKTMDNKSHVYLHYEIPLSEIVATFFNQLKTITSGFASFDWSFKQYQTCDAGQLLILINGEPVEEFSEYVVIEKSMQRAQLLTSRLKEFIPRQQYEVRIQAYFKGKIIASSRISPFRKDVTGKLYGGDRSRKDKLLEKQKKGKKSMKNIGRVEIPKSVFLKLFKS